MSEKKKSSVPKPVPKRTKIPSPKVIAAEAIRRAIDGIEEWDEEGLTRMCGSRVNAVKRMKALEQAKKITKKLYERCTAVVEKHYS